MGIYTVPKEKTTKNIDSFNIILADSDNETFKRVQNLNDKFNFINLSSNFAVNFILEYEKINLVIISKKISDLQGITKRANKKKIKVYVMGEDIHYPLNEKELENLILREIEESEYKKGNGRFSFKKYFSNLLSHNEKNKALILHDEYKSLKKESKSLDGVKKETDIGYKERLYNAENFNEEVPEVYKENSNKKENENNDLDKGNSPKGDVLEEETGIEIKKIRTLKQKIIIILKAKGGVGSTTISIFLGFVFNKIKTLLVDLNFSEGGGDISYYFNIPKSPSILNFVDGYNRDSLDNSVIKIKENLDVMQAPPTYDLSKKIDLQDIYALADIAKKKYHLVIFDLPNNLDDLSLGVIDLANLLIMVSDGTLGSISRLVNINDRFLCSDLDKVLVINKYDKLNGLGFLKNRAEQFFHLKNLVFVDESRELRNRSEFSNFNFNNLKGFNYLEEKIFDLLTYD